ncbi:MAG: sigma-70 family RNA polymerase sigma factor [Planctomycetes bacterium]|nr:sigma-70 family RNA polymerase sigma factor [Planctomycetota bacterium]
MSRDPDLDLVEAFRAGRATAFDDLVRRHEARVLRVCRRILSDAEAALDAAQETFVKAWRALGGFHGDARFSTWVTRIAINQCRNELRRRRTVKHTQPLSIDAVPAGDDAPLVDALAAPGPAPHERLRAAEVAAALTVALAELDDESREVVVLRDAEDLGYEEIAEVLDVPLGTVRSRLHRARGELRRRMGSVLDDAPRTAPAPGERPRPDAPRAGSPLPGPAS